MNLDDIFTSLGKLGGAPGYALVTVFCVIACFGLTKWKRFPNDGIWLTGTLLGGALNAMIADPMSDRLTFRVWLVKNVVFGCVCGGIGAILNASLLRRLVKKLGGNGDTEMLAKPEDGKEAPKP